MSEAAPSIGLALKAAREKKSLSFQDVQSQLKIHSAILEKLEAEDFRSLPAPIYAKGFLQQYASFLGLNTQELLSQFDSLKFKQGDLNVNVGSATKENIMVSRRPDMPTPRAPSRSFPLGRIIVFIILLIVTFYVFKGIGFVWGKVTTRPDKVTHREAAPKAVSPKAQAAAPQAAPSPAKTYTGPFIHSPDAGNFPKIPAGEPIRLEIRSELDSWLRLSQDDKVIYEEILRKGSQERWAAQDTFELKLGRPEGIRMTINGFDLGTPAQGKVKSLVITRQGIRER